MALVVMSLLVLVMGNRQVFCEDPEAVLSSSLKSVIDVGKPSVVAVALFRSTPEFLLSGQEDVFAGLLSDQSPAQLPIRLGGGIVVQLSDDRTTALILTCAHLLEPLLQTQDAAETSRAYVCFGRHQTVPATLHALDGRSDLAVLKVSIPDGLRETVRLQPARMGDASQLAPGQLTVSFGDPRGIVEGDGPAAGVGMISRWDSSRLPSRFAGQTDPLASLGEWLRIDATVGRNLSGGGVFNLQGELVGLTTAVPAVLRPRFEMSYVLPCTSGMQRVIDDLIAGDEVDYGFLGVQWTAETFEHLSSRKAPLLRMEPGKEFAGVSIEQVTRNSPASRAGLQPRDRILRINQGEVDRSFDAQRRIALLGAGSTVTLTVYRPGTRQDLELTATLMKWPVRSGIASDSTHQRKPAWRGLRVADVTCELPFNSEGFIPEVPPGVLIREVQPGSPAELAGLKIGEFIVKVGEELVETPEEFQSALQYWSHAVPVTLADGREVMIEEAR